MRLEEIVERLTTFGLGHTVLRAGAEGAVLLLPDYGRVLGLWPGARSENALWVNPGFLTMLAIGTKDDGWTNPGGERMWLAPREEFFGDGVPASIDPGRFVGRQERAAYTMENKGEARAWVSNVHVRFRMVRRVTPMDDAQLEEGWGRTWLRRAGCVEETLLQCSGACPPGTRLSSFTQVPAGARARIPLRGHGIAADLFGLPPSEASLRDGCVEVGQAAGPARTLALSADEAGRRILCIVPGEPGRAQLLVKDFDAAGTEGSTGPLVECRWGGRDRFVEVSCSSAPVGRDGKLLWRTSLCVFSGRLEEVETLAVRLAS